MENKIHYEHQVLCEWCIQGIKSHGYSIFVGDLYSEREVEEEGLQCYMCDEREGYLYSCMVED